MPAGASVASDGASAVASVANGGGGDVAEGDAISAGVVGGLVGVGEVMVDSAVGDA
jgi:hypothetical protein